MGSYEEGCRLLEEKFGGGKDNIIALATVTRERSPEGVPRPAVRGVDAYYEKGVFYITTNQESNKMRQIAENREVSVSSCTEMFTACGHGENLGWVLDPRNAELRKKLRASFASWYDSANNENDRNCCILAVRLTKGTLNINHWEKLYHLDFVHHRLMENAGVS